MCVAPPSLPTVSEEVDFGSRQRPTGTQLSVAQVPFHHAMSSAPRYGDYIRVQDKVFTPVDDRVRGWSRVGREEEGTSSYRAELAALLMLLCRVQIESDVVVLLDWYDKGRMCWSNHEPGGPLA